MQEVKKATKSLKNDKSTGPELIKKEFIKYGGNKLLEKLTYFSMKSSIMSKYQNHG